MKQLYDLLSLGIAAERLGVHIETMRAWVRSGKIPALRMGERFVRVYLSDVIDALSPPGFDGQPPRADDEQSDCGDGSEDDAS